MLLISLKDFIKFISHRHGMFFALLVSTNGQIVVSYPFDLYFLSFITHFRELVFDVLHFLVHVLRIRP